MHSSLFMIDHEWVIHSLVQIFIICDIGVLLSIKMETASYLHKKQDLAELLLYEGEQVDRSYTSIDHNMVSNLS